MPEDISKLEALTLTHNNKGDRFPAATGFHTSTAFQGRKSGQPNGYAAQIKI